MAGDLSATPASGLRAQLCGDAHMLNFRLLASPERNLMFDINDFDETLPGPWEWDVKRLAASLVIAGRENGYSDRERRGIVRACVRSYRVWMRRFAGMHDLDVWYAKADADSLSALASRELNKRGRRRLSRSLAKARTQDRLQAFAKLARVVDGERRIATAPPLVVPIADLLPDLERGRLEAEIRGLVAHYGTSLQGDRRVLLEQFRY